MRKMGIALQLFTLRNEMEKDFTGTLRRVAEMGYEGVEFAGYGGLPADELRSLLDELNLIAVGSHVSRDRLRDHADDEIKYSRTLGCPYLVCPVIELDERFDLSSWEQNIRLFDEVGERIQNAGLQFCYHNHAFEFEFEIDGRSVFETLFTRTDPKFVKMEIDAAWVHKAGIDPVTYLREYRGRVPLLHFKDYKKGNNPKINTVELGQGDVDLMSVYESAHDTGVEWLIVEQDHCTNPPLESVETSMMWIRDHIKN